MVLIHSLMKLKFLIVLLIISRFAYSQGLNAELGFNEDYDQTSKELVCVGDFSYLVKFQKSYGFFSKCALYKIDTLGNIMWNVPIDPVFAEFITVQEMIPSETNGVYIMGFGMTTCDVGQHCFWFIQKFDANGVLQWTNTWKEFTCTFSTQLTGLSLTANNELLVNYLDSASISKVYKIDSSGFLTDSVQTTITQLKGFCELPGYDFITYGGDSLFAFDISGNIPAIIGFTNTIQNISSVNDSLYVLTTDSIFIFDNNLNGLQGSGVTGYSQFSHLKSANNKIHLVSSGTNGLALLELNNQLQLQNTTSIPVASDSVTHMDYSDSHFSVAHDFSLTLHHTLRYTDYSLNSTQSAPVYTSDIGVSDLDITQTLVQLVSPPGAYLIEIWVTAKIINYGANLLNTCRINHRISPWGICSEEFYTNEFTNLNLSPNDSISINLGKIHSNIYSYLDTVDVNICVYTSHPNQVTDTIVANDQSCKYLLLGFVGIEENELQNISISPNPVQDVFHIENLELLNLSIYVYNNLGQLVFVDSGDRGRFSVDLSNQRSGMHLVRMVSKKGEITRKIIKQ